MTVESILKRIADRGLALSLDGTNLRLEGPQSAIDPELVRLIRSAKSALVEHLCAPKAPQRDGADGSVELTPMQASYFYGRQDHFAMGGVSSHVYHEIEGVFDLTRLEAALAKVVERHGMLRTWFAEEAIQAEYAAAACPPVRIAVADLRSLHTVEQEEARRATRAAMAHQVLPADRAPLIDVRLSILGDAAMILHVSHDGLIMDGISSLLFFDDWHRAYAEPEGLGEPLQVSFFDYVRSLAALRTAPDRQRARDYLLGRLESIPPHPQLPLRRNPAAMKAPVSVRHEIRLAAQQWSALKTQAADRALTPNAVLIAAYAEVLSLWGAGEHFTLNITLANRLPIHPDIGRVIGNFTDCLLLPIEIDGQADFTQRATATQSQLREALDHRQFSGLDVMRELGRRAGSAQAVPMPFTFNSAIGGIRDGSALAAWGRETYSVSQTPQVWLNVFVLESEGALVIQIDSVDAIFPEGLVAALTGGFERLLVALAAGAAWRDRDHALLPQDQLARRRTANETGSVIPAGQAYCGFLRHAEAAPDAVAIDTGVRSLSYGELRAGACAVARWLAERGIERNDLVGVVMQKGWQQIVAILGTCLAGAAYVPLEAGLPARRIDALLANGPMCCTLVQQDRPGAASLVIDDAFLERALQAEAHTRPEDLVPAGAEQGDLAYVLYTSGSTGAPKGVMITHRNLANLIADATRRFDIGAGDRLFAVSSCSFDLSVFDIFGALSTGAALVIPEAARVADPEHWLDLAAAAGVTVWNSVPAIVGMLIDQADTSGRALPPRLRLVLMSGDRIPVALPARISALKPDVRIVSLGGPTETTVWNILYPIDHPDPAGDSIPYGKPNNNNRAYILDAQRRESPDWVPGELHAAGEGLANGYWRDPALTDACFFEHPALRERLYRTGDIARYRPDGNIDLLGRADFQIKLNGYRIEPAEIEAVLANRPGIAAAIVVSGTGEDGPRLIACLVAAGNRTDETERHITTALEDALPGYMVPRQFVWFDRFPLSENGKVDRTALAEAVASTVAQDAAEDLSAAPSELETQLVGIWSDILRDKTIESTSEFYSQGGTSLSAVRLLARIRKEFGLSVPLAEFPRLDTPRKMAARLDQTRRRAKAS
ncbi:MAG: amino acid adenylation domain-containing protein [Aliidongia sp.]